MVEFVLINVFESRKLAHTISSRGRSVISVKESPVCELRRVIAEGSPEGVPVMTVLPDERHSIESVQEMRLCLDTLRSLSRRSILATQYRFAADGSARSAIEAWNESLFVLAGEFETGFLDVDLFLGGLGASMFAVPGRELADQGGDELSAFFLESISACGFLGEV